MATIRIADLKLRTIIGTNDWERRTKQDIIINISLDYAATKAAKTDALKDTIDYKAMTKKIIKAVEGSDFFLLEKLTDMVLKIIMEDVRVLKATVRIDKPQALRFSQSVSVELSKTKPSRK